MKLFLSGPITGLSLVVAQANFMAAQIQLEKAGYVVCNPAENKDCGSWLNYMRLSISQMTECDAVASLPGWNYSKGAQIEIALANSLGIEVRDVGDWVFNVHPLDHA